MNTETLTRGALALPVQQRAELAAQLLSSLDAPPETDIQALWLDEARRRADDVDTGKVKLVSGEQLEWQVQALFK
jgi:putative addiction module component (TIGR02574 family)